MGPAGAPRWRWADQDDIGVDGVREARRIVGHTPAHPEGTPPPRASHDGVLRGRAEGVRGLAPARDGRDGLVHLVPQPRCTEGRSKVS